MQATVATFDNGSGSVILDNGSMLKFDADAFRPSGLLKLRPGQRVRIAVSDGMITAVTLSTFPLPVDVTDDEEQ
jgi:hypothetical protein